MGTDELRLRAKWQDYSGAAAGVAERSFYQVFAILFEGTTFSIRAKPQDFTHIYVDIALSADVISEIYSPASGIIKHGITPDYAIHNSATNKTLYVEVKRQDGWVEDKPRSAGRGNAHERSNKFFSPGLLKVMRAKGNLGEDALPFWTVFQGDIARDPCRVREVTCWYDTYVGHYFMWRNSKDPTALVAHFATYLEPLLL